MFVILVLAAILASAHSFSIGRSPGRSLIRVHSSSSPSSLLTSSGSKSKMRLWCEDGMDAPGDSDYYVAEVVDGSDGGISEMKDQILSRYFSNYGAGTERGEFEALLSQIESMQTQSQGSTESLYGDWRLLYTNDDPTRASPFFAAFRKAGKNTKVPSFANLDLLGGTGMFSESGSSSSSTSTSQNVAESIFKLTDAIPIKRIGTVKQSIEAGELVSRVEVIAEVAGTQIGKSLMTTSSSWIGTNEGFSGPAIEVSVKGTQVLDSTLGEKLGSLPLIGKFLDPATNPLLGPTGFPSGAALELVAPGSSTVGMYHSYADEDLRIMRYEGSDRLFVFVKD